jgi:hypothetical protein
MAIADDNLVTEKVKIYESGVSINSMDGLYDYGSAAEVGLCARDRKSRSEPRLSTSYIALKMVSSITDDIQLRVVQILAAAHESKQNGQRIVFSNNDWKPSLLNKTSGKT